MDEPEPAGLPAEADALYAGPPEAFTQARDALAARLRTAGDRAAATRVKALRRPTVAAHLVNATVRRAPDQLEALLDLRRQLVRAQRQVLSGVSADLTGLVRQRRQQVEDLLQVTQQIADEEDRDLTPHREAIRLTFEAAVADEAAGDRVRTARLTKPLPAPAGFGTLAGLAAVPAGSPPGDAAAEPAVDAGAPAGAQGARPRAAEDREAQARAQQQEQERADQARAEQERADQLAQARRMRDDIARAAEQARAHAREVGRQADQLDDAADRAAVEADRRQREAESAAVRATQARRAAQAARADAETASGRARRARDAADRAAAQLQQADALLQGLAEGDPTDEAKG